MTSEEFTNIALSFPGTVARPHFNRIAFKIEGKRIFATLHEESLSTNIFLSLPEQKIFCEMDENIYPVANKWGTQGWTTFELQKTEKAFVLEGLKSAYDEALKKKKKK